MVYPFGLATLISLTNLTSSGQFAGVSLMLAQASYMETALTLLMINARYFLMSLSLSQKIDQKTVNAGKNGRFLLELLMKHLVWHL